MYKTSLCITIPANQAVAVNPDFEYAVVQCDGVGAHVPERLIIAQDLLTDVMARYDVEHYRVVAFSICTSTLYYSEAL